MAHFPWMGLIIGVGLMMLVGALTSRLTPTGRIFFIVGVGCILLGLLVSGSAGAADQKAGKFMAYTVSAKRS